MFRPTDEQGDRHALLNVEDVLVLSAAGRPLAFLGAAVKVEDVDLVEVLPIAIGAFRERSGCRESRGW